MILLPFLAVSFLFSSNAANAVMLTGCLKPNGKLEHFPIIPGHSLS